MPDSNKGVKISGAPTRQEVSNSPGFPAPEYWRRGPLAFIECVEEIPCNPCEQSCPKGAITVGSPITNLPVLDPEKCIGCGLCIARCPGLAIYVKDYNYSEKEVAITIPYEYWPSPAKGQAVQLVDEMGEVVCEGVVVRVVNTPQNKQTPLVTIRFPKEYFTKVISMQRLKS